MIVSFKILKLLFLSSPECAALEGKKRKFRDAMLKAKILGRYRFVVARRNDTSVIGSLYHRSIFITAASACAETWFMLVNTHPQDFLGDRHLDKYKKDDPSSAVDSN